MNNMKEGMSYDPDRVPWLDVPQARLNMVRSRRYDYSRYKVDKKSHDLMARASALLDLTFDYEENVTYKSPIKYNSPFTAAVSVPVGVEAESNDGILPTFVSLREAAGNVGDPVLVVAYLNYTGDPRREREKLKWLHDKSMSMKEEITGVLSNDNNTELIVVEDHMPAGTQWPQLRTAMKNVPLKFLLRHFPTLGGEGANLNIVHNLPHFQVDSDTTVSDNSIVAGTKILEENRAIIVGGTNHYTGGIMDEPLHEVAKKDSNSKLIYLAEILRRKMFDHLPPGMPRGYFSESAMGIKFGSLVSLGGFEGRSAQNESYFLLEAAVEALEERFEVPKFDEVRIYPKAHIDSNIADQIESIAYYAPYDISNSIRGIEAMVRRYGRNMLIPYDQGVDYATWTDLSKLKPDIALEPKLSVVDVLPFLSSVYSSFKDMGGELRIEDLSGGTQRTIPELNGVPAEEMSMNELITRLFAESSNEIVNWLPRYVPKDLREGWLFNDIPPRLQWNILNKATDTT